MQYLREDKVLVVVGAGFYIGLGETKGNYRLFDGWKCVVYLRMPVFCVFRKRKNAATSSKNRNLRNTKREFEPVAGMRHY